MDSVREDCYWFCKEYGIEASGSELSRMAEYAMERIEEGMDREEAISYATELLF